MFERSRVDIFKVEVDLHQHAPFKTCLISIWEEWVSLYKSQLEEVLNIKGNATEDLVGGLFLPSGLFCPPDVRKQDAACEDVCDGLSSSMIL